MDVIVGGASQLLQIDVVRISHHEVAQVELQVDILLDLDVFERLLLLVFCFVEQLVDEISRHDESVS